MFKPAIDIWRREPSARRFLLAQAQGSLGAGAGYVALMVLAYERIGSAWAGLALAHRTVSMLALALVAGAGTALFRPATFALVPGIVARRNRARIPDRLRHAVLQMENPMSWRT